MDLVRYSLACLGEQIHVAAWPATTGITHNPHSKIFDSLTEAAAKHHAAAAQAFVINVQSRIDQDTIDKLGLTDQPDMMRTGGGWSAIIDPSGQIIAGPHRDEEKIIYADLDLSEIIFANYATDSTGHYARPDVVRLLLNHSKQTVVEFVDSRTFSNSSGKNFGEVVMDDKKELVFERE